MKTVSWIRWRKTVREKSIGPKVTICDTGTTGLLHAPSKSYTSMIYDNKINERNRITWGCREDHEDHSQ